MIGGCFGLLLFYVFELMGGGISLIFIIMNGGYGVGILLLLFVGWIFIILFCFGLGVFGGIFVFMFVLGILFGYVFGLIVKMWFLELNIEFGMFVIVGMGVLFVVIVWVFIMGILLVIEMINNYYLILLLIIISLGVVIFV